MRVNWLLSPGSPGCNEHDDPRYYHTTGNGGETAAPGTEGLLLRHQPNDEEVASIAVFAASDWARTITATEIDFTGGAVID